MRVLVMADLSSPHAIRWINTLRQKGIEVHALSFETPDEIKPEFYLITPKVSSRKWKYILGRNDVERIIEKVKPDILNPHFIPNYGLLAALLKGERPIFLCSWGSDLLVIPRKSWVKAKITRFILKKSDKILVDANIMLDALMKLGIPRSKAIIMPLGIERDLRNRELQSLSSGKTKIVCTRRLAPDMDPATILRAAKILLDMGVDFELYFTSRGPLEAKLKGLAYALGLFENVVFTGWLSSIELHNLVASSHIFVSASLTDSTSVSLLEAMALGAVPVVSDIPGNREWVIHSLNGYLFPVKDHEKLAELLYSAATDIDFLNRARQLNKELIQKRANWEENMDFVISTMENLVEKRTKSTSMSSP